MRYIVPTQITDAMLVSSSVAENDHPAWSAATAYSIGTRVIRVATHSIYERLVAGTTAAAPESDAVNWVRVGPTNRWAMLDSAVGTSTAAASSISVVLLPGVVRGLALLDMDVESVSVSMEVAGQVVYSTTIDPLALQENCEDWFGYFFDAVVRRRVVVLNDLPPYAEAELTVTATGTGDITIGSLVVGQTYAIGDLLAEPTIGITDYSRKMTDDFGAVTISERSYSRRMSAQVSLQTPAVDVTAARLARMRAKPAVWIGSATLESLVVYGYLKDWGIVIPGRVLSTCSLEIEGLV